VHKRVGNDPSRVDDINADGVLDAMHYQMNSIIDEMNNQVDEEEKQKQQHHKCRRLWIMFAILVGTIVVMVELDRWRSS
jgi:hypothetical protein